MSYSKKPTRLMREAINIALQYGGGKLKRGDGGIWTYDGKPIDETREPTHGFVETTIRSLLRWGFVRVTEQYGGSGYMIEVEVVHAALRQGVPPEMLEALHIMARLVASVERAGQAGQHDAQDDARAVLRRYGLEPP